MLSHWNSTKQPAKRGRSPLVALLVLTLLWSMAGSAPARSHPTFAEQPAFQQAWQRTDSRTRTRADRLSEGVYTETLGALRAFQGRMEEANELLRFALERAREMGSKKDEMLAFLSLSRLWLSARNMHLSLTYARNARDLAREVGDERIACESALLMAEGYRRSDKWMPAEDWAMMAKAELERLPYPYLDAILQRNIASFVSRRRDPLQGERIFRQAEESFRSMNAAYQVAVTIFEHGDQAIRVLHSPS